MAKLIFTGTEEQLMNLMVLVEEGEGDLPTIREDYQIQNLWCVDDVQSIFECTEEQALMVLEQALTNEATMQQIWYAIEFHGENNKLKRR